MNWRIVELALLELRRSWLRSSLSVAGIAVGILVVTFFARELELKQEDILSAYEHSGAAAIVIRLSGVSDQDVAMLAAAIRQLKELRSVDAPYSGIEFATKVATAFVVFQNEHQAEELGAEGNILGVDQAFAFDTGYYVDFHDLSPQASDAVLGIPLLLSSGTLRPPRPGELLVPAEVADYVGIGVDAKASIELIYTAASPPITMRIDKLRVIGTFDVVGPDKGRFDPFWRLNAQAQEVLTVRTAGDERATSTVPVIINAEVLRDFMSFAKAELNKRGSGAAGLARQQIVVQAQSLSAVPALEQQIADLLRSRGLGRCRTAEPSFCPVLPERNNFRSALREHAKFARGAAFFVGLLLALITVAAGGMQGQAAVKRWRDYGVLKALGFSPLHILTLYGAQLVFLLAIAVLIAALLTLAPLPFAGAWEAFGLASALTSAAAALGSLPALLWPVLAQPTIILAETP